MELLIYPLSNGLQSGLSLKMITPRIGVQPKPMTNIGSVGKVKDETAADTKRSKIFINNPFSLSYYPVKHQQRKSNCLPIFRVIYQTLSYPPLSPPLHTQRHIDPSTKQQQQQQTPPREKR